MGERSSIGWTDATLNILGGCTEAGPECEFCYARTLTANRFAASSVPGMAPYRKLAVVSAGGRPQWTRAHHFFAERLHRADRWSPRKIFLNDLSDTFYEPVTRDELDAMFLMMERLPQHTWQVLTKRAERMAAYAREWPARMGRAFPRRIWMGCTTGTQASFEARWAHLSTVDAGVLFLSVEPMLEAMDIRAALTGPTRARLVIVGGESGPRARPFDLAWARSILRQCADAGVLVFVKQVGDHPVDGARAAVYAPCVHEGRPAIRTTVHAADAPEVAAARAAEREARARGVSTTLVQHPLYLREHYRYRAHHGADPAEWPVDLRCREFPEVAHVE